MREYLFHGKRKDNGRWVEGMPCSDLKGGVDAIQSNLGGGIFDIYPESFGQYTGMKDKNGRKIFEGNIVNCITSDFDGSDKYVYNFRITDIADFEQMGFLNFCNAIEIIGNIHDNADLLEG